MSNGKKHNAGKGPQHKQSGKKGGNHTGNVKQGADPKYAGATFQNAPAASALPIPTFSKASSPSATLQSVSLSPPRPVQISGATLITPGHVALNVGVPPQQPQTHFNPTVQELLSSQPTFQHQHMNQQRQSTGANPHVMMQHPHQYPPVHGFPVATAPAPQASVYHHQHPHQQQHQHQILSAGIPPPMMHPPHHHHMQGVQQPQQQPQFIPQQQPQQYFHPQMLFAGASPNSSFNSFPAHQ